MNATNPVPAASPGYRQELDLLLATLPPAIATALNTQPLERLVEVVLDYGRRPEARFLGGGIVILEAPSVERSDLQHVVDRVGAFSGDNRAGIPRTLHRISAIRNRAGDVVGLTCRVGKALMGTIAPIQDLVTSDKSILLLGRPGVGKTTKLREIARTLADEHGKRVIVVDTSNEIAGDGDIPHPAVGRARRMQVPHPNAQEQIMIEAVENHTPEVIVVDEIGTEAEAQAARTIAERGVLLIATAHGGQLENLIKNPVLSDLVGGIQSVTLGDEEAKRRSSQKTVLEREKQPTFDICVELHDRHTMAVYPNLAEAVDHLLRGWSLFPEVRRTNDQGEVQILNTDVDMLPGAITPDALLAAGVTVKPAPLTATVGLALQSAGATPTPFSSSTSAAAASSSSEPGVNDEFRVFLYAISRSFVDRIVDQQQLQRQVRVTEHMHDAHAVIALRGQTRPGSKILRLAVDYDVPVYYAKTNTLPQIQRAVREMLEAASNTLDGPFAGRWAEKTRTWLQSLQPPSNEDTAEALEETLRAIETVMSERQSVELTPRRSYIRRLQHELVERHNLLSLSVGDEPNRRLKILPPK